MLRMRRVTDQGFVVLAYLLRADGEVHTAREISQGTTLPPATTAKVLKGLQRGGLVRSTRGVQGGYSIDCDPASTTVLRVIEVFEGPIGLTDCSLHDAIDCDVHDTCSLGPSWPPINEAVLAALRNVSLLDLVRRTSASDQAGAAPGLRVLSAGS